MPGLDPKIAQHYLSVSKRKYSPLIENQIASEINKLKEANFIREVQYPSWLANIVPVKKKNGQIRICIDFRDLNKACPKDAFPLPIPDILLDNVVGHEMFSFMDGFSGYNQVGTHPTHQAKTTFVTPQGTFLYEKMAFGLCNVPPSFNQFVQ